MIKITSNNVLYESIKYDMGINDSAIIGGHTFKDVGDDIINLIRKVIASDLINAEKNRQNGIVCVYTLHTSF